MAHLGLLIVFPRISDLEPFVTVQIRTRLSIWIEGHHRRPLDT